jgi:hypothetical protein
MLDLYFSMFISWAEMIRGDVNGPLVILLEYRFNKINNVCGCKRDIETEGLTALWAIEH